MLEQALVFLKIDPTKDKAVLSALRQRKDVKNVYFLYGPYDIYVELLAETLQDLEGIVTGALRKIPGVRSSMTIFVAD
jgi:DNA-binding Lrp family transcriptional regulator